MNRKLILKQRLKHTEKWIEGFLDIEKHREISKKALKNLNKDRPILGLVFFACSIVSDITNGKYNVLKWDKQERKYYPIEINLYEKGEIDD